MSTQRNAAAMSIGFLALAAGILIVLNVLAYHFGLGRIDTTKNRLWSLSDGSQRLVGRLEDQMDITAYFTEDLPPPFNSTSQYVRDLLGEYEAASNGNVRVRFVNPDDDEKREEAEADGIQRVQHQVIENDAVSVREGYRGLVIKYLGESQPIPVIQDVSGLEYTITTKIREMADEPRPLGVISGHEGPTPSEGLARLASAMPSYTLREVDANQPIDQELAAVLLVSPTTALSEPELRNIDQYVMHGGSLGVFSASLDLNLGNPQEPGAGPSATGVDSGINQLLNAWGVESREDLAFDWICSRAPMAGPFGMQVAVPYPAVPIINLTDDQQEHPVFFRIPTAAIAFSSTLALRDAPEGVNVTTLAKTSENSWRQGADTAIDLAPRHPREWPQTADSGPFPLMMAISGTLPSAFPTSAGGEAENALAESEGDPRVLVSGAASFLRDEFIPESRPGQEVDLSAALALALNSIDWLAADTELVAIRAKNVEDPALEIPAAVQEAEDTARAAAEEQNEEGVEDALEERKEAVKAWDRRKAIYKWGNILGIPMLFALFGVVRWRMRTARRASMKL